MVSRGGKTFWLKFRCKLEVLNETKVLFPLGEVYLTIGAREALDESNQTPNEFLVEHQRGDWGLVGDDDRREAEKSI